ncbi:MAG: LemA family protein [Nitrospirae bacterium]|nr:LemA family protein [Nitrospirota bacterium]
MTWFLIAFIVVIPPAWAVLAYNRLITLRVEVKNAWHQIDVQLKRRHDLIPNLVTVVKGYMDFEQETLEKVVKARTKALSASSFHEKAVSEIGLSQAVSGLLAVIENYPTLKANENVLRLQEELTTTENRIAFARQFYNDLVANFRTKIEVFPDNIIASVFHFRPAEYFSADAEDRALPKADMSARPK